MKKKLISTVILIVVFSFCLQFPVLAASSSANGLSAEHYQQIYNQLDMLIDTPNFRSLGSNVLSNLQLGNPVPAYRFTGDRLERLDFTIYPLFSSSSIPYIALQIKLNDGRVVMQVSENSIPELSRYINTNIAVVYDSTKRHIISSGNILSSVEFSVDPTFASSCQAQLTAFDITNSSITYANNNLNSRLNYTPASYAPRSSTYVTFSVPLVYQTYSRICWAACVACISNRLSGTSYTAPEIAKDYANSTVMAVWNVTRTMSEIVSCLSIYGSLSYYRNSIAPTQQRIYNNINAGYPMVGGYTSSIGRHGVVIYGIAMDEWIQIMDPWNGFLLSYRANGNFQYVSPENSYLYILDEYAAKVY